MPGGTAGSSGGGGGGGGYEGVGSVPIVMLPDNVDVRCTPGTVVGSVGLLVKA